MPGGCAGAAAWRRWHLACTFLPGSVRERGTHPVRRALGAALDRRRAALLVGAVAIAVAAPPADRAPPRSAPAGERAAAAGRPARAGPPADGARRRAAPAGERAAAAGRPARAGAPPGDGPGSSGDRGAAEPAAPRRATITARVTAAGGGPAAGATVVLHDGGPERRT